jgi:tripartite-type tricarboxylate transporter receptor subunit TctC
MPEVRAHFATLSMQPVGGSPDDLAQLIRSETQRWGEVIRDGNLQVE